MLCLLALYSALPDKVFVFDGVMFAAFIDRIGDDWQQGLLNRRHLLFNPLMMLLHDTLIFLGAKISAYSLAQRFNAFLGVLGALLYFRTIVRLSQSRVIAGLATSFLAVSYCYWCRASEGQVYMLMTFGAIATFYCAIVLWQSRSRSAAVLLCATWAFAVWFHIVNVCLFPMILVTLWFWSRKRGISTAWRWVFSLSIVFMVSLPFAVAFKIYTFSSLISFFQKAAEFYSPGHDESSAHLISRFFNFGGIPWDSRMAAIFQEYISAAVITSPTSFGSSVGGIGLFLGFAGMSAAAWREEKSREPAVILALWWGGYVFMNAFWRGGEFFWASPVAAFLAAASIWAAPRFERASNEGRRAFLGCACIAALMLCGWNLRNGIYPRSRLENNNSYALSLFIREHTAPLSWTVISGIKDSNLKAYLPYFAGRRRDVLEFYFNDTPKIEGLRLLKDFFRRNIGHGVPIYMLSDLLEDETIVEYFEKRWGVSGEELRDAFGPGHVIRIATHDSGTAVFHFIPEKHVDRLFATTVFQALIEPERQRLQELAGMLKYLASRELAPSHLRAAISDLPKSNYGVSFLWDGLIGGSSPRFRSKAEKIIAQFNAWKKTAHFNLKLGDLYYGIGFIEGARYEWTKAYDMTKDPAIAARIAKLSGIAR